VVDGLYSAVEKVGLSVSNMTLEPIAAINVAIPINFRMLNIALVDVGAGTSDLCITRDGSIAAYGMIPYAGDELTVNDGVFLCFYRRRPGGCVPLWNYDFGGNLRRYVISNGHLGGKWGELFFYGAYYGAAFATGQVPAFNS
jgi:hypothetical protein